MTPQQATAGTNGVWDVPGTLPRGSIPQRGALTTLYGRASVSPPASPHFWGPGAVFWPQRPDPAARKEEGTEAGAKAPGVTGVSHGAPQPPLRSRTRNRGFGLGLDGRSFPGRPGRDCPPEKPQIPSPGGGWGAAPGSTPRPHTPTARHAAPRAPKPHGDPPGPFTHRSRAGGSVSAAGKPRPRAASSRFLAQETLLPGGFGGQESPAGIPACPPDPQQFLFPPPATRISTFPTPLLPLGDPFPFWGAHGIESPVSPAPPMSPTSHSPRVSVPILTPPRDEP